jgi:hypothetical protein
MTIEVKVLPKSGRDEIGFVNGILRVRFLPHQ